LTVGSIKNAPAHTGAFGGENFLFQFVEILLENLPVFQAGDLALV
jgi:hypothetical protein